MDRRTHGWMRFVAVMLGVGVLSGALASADDNHDDGQGAVFVMTNSADRDRGGNHVVMYERDQDGDLTFVGAFPTGHLELGQPQLGSGPAPAARFLGVPVPLAGDGLSSSDALILAQGHDCLFAVNGGSNTISSFQVHRHGLELSSVVSSQGSLTARFPNSLAASYNTLYVLNAGDQGSLSGFRILGQCALAPLAGSSRDLSGLTNSFPVPAPGDPATLPAQITFSPDGKRLVLSIVGGPDNLGPLPSGRMVVFPVGHSALLGAPVVTPFSFTGGTGGPFSFIFAKPEVIIVTHVNSGTVASYKINAQHHLTLLSGPFPTVGFAPCWLDSDGRFVYTVSFGGVPAVGFIPDGDGILDGFRLNQHGSLAPLGVSVAYPAPGPGQSGNHGVDLRVIGRFLYFLQPRTGMIGRFTIESNGALSHLTNFGGLLAGPEPFAGFNPGINNFLERCFLQNPVSASPECLRGSAQGIVGF